MRKFFLEQPKAEERGFLAPKRKKRRAMLSKYRAQMPVLDFVAITVTVVQIEHVVFEKRAVPCFGAALLHSRNTNYTDRTVLVAPANCTFVNWVKKGWKIYRTADLRQPPRPVLFIFSGSSFSGAKLKAHRSESTCGAFIELAGSFMSSRSRRMISLAFCILAEAE